MVFRSKTWTIWSRSSVMPETNTLPLNILGISPKSLSSRVLRWRPPPIKILLDNDIRSQGSPDVMAIWNAKSSASN